MSLVAILLAVLIGLSLGLVGGGGSILTVPALVYAAGFEPHAAVAGSLVVVGLTALAGAFFHRRGGTLSLRVALWFGGLGALGAALGGLVGRDIPERLLMGGFSLVALAAGLAMLRRRSASDETRPMRGLPVVAATALGVGFMTGLFGVGGGFLIVPALVLVVGLTMARAVGTSLAVIAFNCASGVAVSFQRIEPGHWPVIGAFVALAVGGSLVGARTARKARPAALRRVFGLLVLCVGVYTAARSLLG